ncbi:hypothetical protein RIF29_08409 [Crotalaria pallida]|uniref:Uncharacterized protein n=1 Tax=Crotalaria pallida TaxID=3830 RepID=A0AAN9IIY6_CROPI
MFRKRSSNACGGNVVCRFYREARRPLPCDTYGQSLANILISLQDFSDPRDADDARYHLDGRDFDGSRIIVEFAKGVRTVSHTIVLGPPCLSFTDTCLYVKKKWS